MPKLRSFFHFTSKTIAPIALLLLSFLAPAYTQNREQIEKELLKIIKLDPNLNMDDIPAYLIGIIYKDSTFVYGYGDTGIPSQAKPNEQTIFEIGGLTKVFTASLAEILAEKGILQMDSSLNSYLPAAFRNPRMEQVKIIDLLAHASGLLKMPVEFGAHEKDGENPYAHYSKKDLLLFYKDFVPTKTTATYIYSHVNYALLEVVIELQTKQHFEVLLNKELLAPLGIRKTFVGSADSSMMAQGHSIGGQESKLWSFSSFAASVGLKSCMEDLLRFARFQLSEDANPLSPMLFKTHQKIIVTDYSERAFSAKGWHLIERKKYFDTLIHTGNTGGFRSFFAFIPDSQTAVIVLSNSEMATGGLGYLALRLINNNFRKRKKKRTKP